MNGTGSADSGVLEGAVIAVAGAAGPAGRATLLRLAEAGATVVASDANPERLVEAVDAARYAHGGATVTGDTVDLLDPGAAREWAVKTEKEFGRVDGLVHLVGGWRGGANFADTSLADWDYLEKLLIRTVQSTSLAFHEVLQRSDLGRYVLVSASGARQPHRRKRGLRRVQGGRRGVDARPGRLLPQGGGRQPARHRLLRSWSSRHWCTTRCAPSARMRSSRASRTSRSWPRPSPGSGTCPPEK